MCVHVAHVSAVSRVARRGIVDKLQLESQEVVNSPKWVLEPILAPLQKQYLFLTAESQHNF